MAVTSRARANAVSHAHLFPSVNIEIPPTHPAWRAYWSKEDDNAFREIERTQAMAKQARDTSEAGSSDYWEAMRVDNKMEMARAEIKWRLCQKVLGFNPRRSDYQWMHRGWLTRRAQLDDQRTFIEKMALQTGYRNSLLSFVKMERDALPVDGREVVDAIGSLMTPDKDSMMVQNLVTKLKRDYGAKMVGKTQVVWSPLEGDWRMQHELKATSILPFSFGDDTVNFLYNRYAKRCQTFSAGNALFLPLPVAHALRSHHVTLAPVPVQDEDTDVELAGAETGNAAPTDAIEYKLVVVDKAEVWDRLAFRDTPFSKLDGRSLKFLPGNSNRPSDHYLYIHFLISVTIFVRKLRVDGMGKPEYTPDFQTVKELLNMWPNEKTQFGENLGGLLQQAMKTVRETLTYPDAPDKAVPVNTELPTLARVTPKEFQTMLDMLAISRVKPETPQG